MKIKVFHNISPNFTVKEVSEHLEKFPAINIQHVTHAIKEDGEHYYTIFYDETPSAGNKSGKAS